jgi:hypothetical protein
MAGWITFRIKNDSVGSQDSANFQPHNPATVTETGMFPGPAIGQGSAGKLSICNAKLFQIRVFFRF